MLKKIKKGLKNPRKIILYFLNFKIFRIIPDKLYLKIKFRLIMNKKLDLKNPQTFNEKLQWLKLYDRNPKYTDLVDKYKVRDYIKQTIGEEYLIPLIGVWNTFDEIDFTKLPNQFVLKPNHTSGNVFICKDKSTINYDKLRKEVNKWMKRKYYWLHREWPYKNIKPKIICEKYMIDKKENDLKDYKLMCFNGKVKCSFVCSNRNSHNGLNVDFYNLDWELLPFSRHYPNSRTIISKPSNYEKMCELSEKLSAVFPFVRMDFYEINNKLYFGEFTFYPGSGFEEFTPKRYDILLGSWLSLDEIN